MAAISEQKLFGGARVRRLRKERGLTQARMAEDLGVSTSYLNLIERNQRPITAQLLLKLAETYDLDFKSFSASEEIHALAALNEVFRDPLFEGYQISRQELQDLAHASPEASQALLTLYHAYREATSNATDLAQTIADQDQRAPSDMRRFPAEDVRDVLRARQNHFPELEEAAEDLVARAQLGRDDIEHALRAYLGEGPSGLGVSVVPVDVLPATLRFYDRHRRRILLSEMLPASGRIFQLACQIALLEHGAVLDRLVAEANLAVEESRRLLRINLANYFAAAVMMPYERFLSAAETLRYDIDILARRFGASFEQVCHRLTTLQRPGARGVPFFMIRVDNAGNVSKRFSAGSFQFARLGGACPRWNVHHAFQTPQQIFTQMIRMPDGETYFSIARTVDRAGAGFPTPDQQLAIGLGCELSYARRLVYADGHNVDNHDAATPIGINCRLCERADCSQRAFPPLNRRLVVDENRRELSPFTFSVD